MANESFAQGLLQNLLAPQQQRMSPQDIMAAMSSPNPMASVMAASVPQTTQAIGQGIRGMIGGITGQTPYSATEAYNKAMQQISQQPGFGTTSDSLTAMAQAANAVGRIPEAMQLMAQANELKKAEQAETETKVKGAKDRLSALSTIEDLITNTKDENARGRLKALTYPIASGTMNIDEGLKTAYDIAGEKPDEISAYQAAQLQEKFTSESVAAHLKDPTKPLVPRPTSDDNLSNMSRMLTESGFGAAGTPAHMEAMRSYTDSIITANEGSRADAIASIQRTYDSRPTVAKTAESRATVDRIKAALPLLDTNNPQAFTVLSSAVPALFDSNVRAAQEIENFRRDKGITESIGDWLIKIGGGTATQETKNNIKELINNLDASILAQQEAEVRQVIDLYSGVVDQELLDHFYNTMLSPPDLQQLVDRYTNN